MFDVLTDSQPLAGKKSITSRQALLVSLGGRVGGGNITGAVAISLGGPGAVFWTWAMAHLGMATSLAECTLAQIFKRFDGDGAFRGGPADYSTRGLGIRFKWLTSPRRLYARSAGVGPPGHSGKYDRRCSAGICPIVADQHGHHAQRHHRRDHLGGIRRVAPACDVVVPVMARIYIATALFVIGTHLTDVPAVLAQIFRSAFGLDVAFSGGMGAAIAQGMLRG